MKMNDYIPERFRKTIVRHIIKNLMQNSAYHSSLILGIHGPSGYGKTYQCQSILEELQAEVFLISGGQLESPHAGKPAELIRETYIQASRSIEKGESKVAVVLINDIDTGLGNWGNLVQYTTNFQIIFGELMHLTDYPTKVENTTTKRIPIIVTGNDFTKLYGPLLRAGRMTAFEWQPTNQEKVKIVQGIYPELNNYECEQLIIELDKEASSTNSTSLPIAFFSYLRSTLIDDVLDREIEKMGVHRVMDTIREGREPRIPIGLNLDKLIDTGKSLVHSGKLVNHLQGI